MPLTKQQKAYAGVGAVALGGLLLWALSGKKKPRIPDFFLPGQTADVIQGGAYTIRLPRGDYTVTGDELIIMAQTDIGVNTDVSFMVSGAQNEYTAQVLFMDEDDPTQQFKLTVIARRTVDG